jgi:hypothetical protein
MSPSLTAQGRKLLTRQRESGDLFCSEMTMARNPRRSLAHDLELSPAMLADMRRALPEVAEHVVAAVIAEVPSYADALAGPMGQTIRNAVQLALGGFISLAGRRRRTDPQTPAAPAMEGAYQLGRGEARSGRSMDALLAAYRIGARVSWREMSSAAVRSHLDSETLAQFAELVFTYIDELSAASAAGHTDELATTGRVRERLLERLATLLVTGEGAAARAGWPEPTTLTAVLAPTSRARSLFMAMPEGSLLAPQDLLDDEEHALVLVPDAHGRRRKALLRGLRDSGAVAGPARPWLDVPTSVQRANRAMRLGITDVDTDLHLGELVRTADPDALADLRQAVLAPLKDVRESSADKLADTLAAWLRHHGRREDIAAALFVHPQTVRYRMGQLRDLYGDRLTDPAFVRDATIALA